MTAPLPRCAYCRCPQAAHQAGLYTCGAEGCHCRMFIDRASLRSIASHRAGKAAS